MTPRTKEELTAMLRLMVNPEFKMFTGWLSKVLEETKTDMVQELDDMRLRQKQGEALALTNILAALANTKTVLERMDGRS